MADLGDHLTSMDIEHRLNSALVSASTLNFLHLNTRSCRGKMSDLIQLINDFQHVHVVVFSETWLYQNEICNMLNYDVYHSCRPGRGGGDSIFILSSIKHRKVYEMVDDMNNFLIVELMDYDLKVFGVYTPGRDVDSFLLKFEETLSNFKRMIILGDMNINLLDDNNAIVNNYKCCINANGFVVMNKIENDYATRISNTISTIIDHVLTDIIDRKMTLTVNDTENLISDHKTLIFSIQYTLKTVGTKFSKCVIHYENILNDSFRLQLNAIQTYDQFENLCNDKINCNKSTYTVHEDKQPLQPYIDRHLFAEIKKKNKLFKLSKANPGNETLRRQYLSLRNSVRNKTKFAKARYYNTKFENCVGNPKKMWATINEVVFNKSSSRQNKQINLVENGTKILSPIENAQIFNDYFLSIGCQTASRRNVLLVENDFPLYFNFVHVSEIDVDQIITKLNRTAAVGKDGISVKFLYRAKTFITPKVTDIINEVITSGIFPDKLKVSKVIPLFKAGDATSKTCFRPISILPATSKIFESVIESQMRSYLHTNNIINKNQYGFQKKSNTVAASADMMNSIYCAKDKGSKVICVFLDFSKAFDCISHSLLLHKIQKYGFSENAIQLLRSYLQNRLQYTSVNNCYSQPGIIVSGVPQGSILGPLLFILYVNDIWELPLKGRLQLYADDSCLVYEAETREQLEYDIQHDMDLLLRWLSENDLRLNVEKSSYLALNNNLSIEVRINSFHLKKVESANFLGLIIDTNLTWKTHIENVIKQVTSYVFAIRKARSFITIETCWKLYNAFILPHFTYMSCLWGCAANIYLKPLEVLQNKVIKIIRNLPFRFPSSNLYNETVLPIHLICKYNMLIHIYKTQNNLIKTNVVLFNVSDVHSHNTRQQHSIFVNCPRTQYGLKNLFYKGTTMYNSLPNELKLLNLSHFKRNLKQYLYNLH